MDKKRLVKNELLHPFYLEQSSPQLVDKECDIMYKYIDICKFKHVHMRSF